MNAERLYAIAKKVQADLATTKPAAHLTALKAAVEKLAEKKDDPGLRQEVDAAYAALEEAVAKSVVNEFPTAWRIDLDQLGGGTLVGFGLGRTVYEVQARHSASPETALEELTGLTTRVEAFGVAIDDIVKGMKGLKVGDDSSPIPQDTADKYLEYLNTEMTIMGILTAFAGAVPSFVLDRTAGSKEATWLSALWISNSTLVLLGSCCLFLAALYFYRQRSLLAYYAGQIALDGTPASFGDKTLAEWITEADLWTKWDYYARAFSLTTLGFIYYGVALVAGQTPAPAAFGSGIYLFPFVAVLAWYLIRGTVFLWYRDEYRPWRRFLLGRTERLHLPNKVTAWLNE